jgi:hypothetical protein
MFIRLATTAAILVFLAFPALADPVKISVVQAQEVVAAVSDLDRVERVKKVDGKDVTVHGADLTVAVRTRLAIDVTRLKPLVDAYAEAHNKRLMELSDGGKREVKPDSPDGIKLQYESLAQMNRRDPVELLRVTLADLSMDVNPIPPETLARLAPLISDLDSVEPQAKQ